MIAFKCVIYTELAHLT